MIAGFEARVAEMEAGDLAAVGWDKRVEGGHGSNLRQ